MEKTLKDRLIDIAKQRIDNSDPSHDFQHAIRVLGLATRIAAAEGADLDIIIPAALFHDVVMYPKNDPRSANATEESATFTRNILEDLQNYPQEKIPAVEAAIRDCSFSKGVHHTVLESQVLQDADSLEATGFISIMRTFASTGGMQRPFYNPVDPFCERHEPDPMHFALDLFYARLLKVEERMYTKTARAIAKRRTEFLRQTLEEFKLELEESEINRT